MRIALVATLTLAASVPSGLRAQSRPEAAITVSGRLTDRTGAPIFGGRVTLVAVSSNTISKTETDQAGRFGFSGLAHNAYELVFEVLGFKRLTIPVSATDKDVDVGTVAIDIAVIEDPVVVITCVPLDPFWPSLWSSPAVRITPDGEESRLVGTVERRFGSPVPGVTIKLTSNRESYSERPTPQGAFQFRHVPPGLYMLTASATGFADFVIDTVEVKAVSRTEIVDALVMQGCPDGVRCPATKQVQKPSDCF